MNSPLIPLAAPCRINGLTHINLTKLDVLSELETIKLGVYYKVDGKRISSVPSEISTLERVEMEYEDVPGWQSDISKVQALTIQ
jgi:adenylosuccinate synthase